MTRSPQQTDVLPRGTAGARAVFLHTGWRSCGTWLWSECRAQPGVVGFYEPLHEVASHLRRSDIARIGPGSWQSSHRETAPYFEEYRSLISKGGRGIALYQPRFAFDSFFLDATEEDPALEAYISALLAVPAAYDEAAVLKFCRSLGRVTWFEQHFPAALHAVIVRNPVAQWRSTRRLLVEQRNRYFSLAPLLVMARNASHPVVRQACAALDVCLPQLHSADMAYGVEKTWRSVKRYTQEESYRAFLAYWTTTMLTALSGQALVIEAESLAADPDYRAGVEQMLQARIGGALRLEAHVSEPEGLAGSDASHEAAAVFARAQDDWVPAERLEIILRLLESRGCGPRHPRPWPAAPSLTTPPRLALAAEIVLARALQPVRRLHGRISFLKKRPKNSTRPPNPK